MVRRLSLVAVVAMVALGTGVAIVPGIALGASATQLSPTSIKFPAAFTLTPDGSRILYGERYTGRIMRLNPGTGTSTLFFKVPNVTSSTGEFGLLGLALSPNYPGDGRVWAFVTRNVSGSPRNQLVRINADGSGFTVLRSFSTAIEHDGGRILFGSDGKLYVVVGDNNNLSLP